MTEETFESAVLELDNHPDILRYTYSDGTSVWPSLRFQLRVKYMESRTANERNQRTVAEHKNSRTKADLIKYMLHCFWRGTWRIQKRPDILSIANYEGDPECPNRMTVFIKELEGLSRCELLYSPRWVAFSRIPDTYSFDYFYFRAWLYSRILRTKPGRDFSKSMEALFGIVETRLSAHIPENTMRQIRNMLDSTDTMTQKYRAYLQRFLKRVRPKFILCSEGNNGDWRHAILFSTARKLGIKTGEVQHGVFNLGMKFGSEIVKKPEFTDQKTTHLFTFGPFHCTQTNLPALCVPLGHYHLEIQKKKSSEWVRENGDVKRILFVCEGHPPSSVNNGLINTTIAALKELGQPFRLVVRLHPSEGPNDKYNPFFEFEGTRYSEYKSENIHELIQSSDVVISHASTVVFEALYFNKPVFVLRDAATGQYISEGTGHWFSTAQELRDLISGSTDYKGIAADRADAYWATGTVKENFLKFWKAEIAANRTQDE